ncbi:MAG: hypothetical protein Q9222_000813 [Ikaeria aurantiellina]
MASTSDQSRPFDILQWRDDVSSTVRARNSPDRLAGRRKHTRPIRRPSRYLADVSANPQKHQPSRSGIRTRKRKLKMEQDEHYGPPTIPKLEKRGRGRPRKSEQQYRASPEDKAKVDKAADLYWKLDDIPHAVIPSSLEASYEAEIEDTPNKSRRGPRHIDYQHNLPYPPHRLPTLKQIVDSVLKKAAWNHKRGAHERQWGATVDLLLEEFTLWPREVEMKALNVENCTVDIEALRTKINSGQILSYKAESVAPRSDDGSDVPSQSVSKMVDWTLALDPDNEDEDIIDTAFNTMNCGECSLNQSSSYIRKSALFTDFELKKPHPGSDPGVQLALWESGALLKKRWHGWDTSLPMPGVFVDGYVWHWCLFVAVGKGLVMLGPFLMGTTETVVGIWQIIYRLNILVNWGTTTYKQWLRDNVMTWARRRVAITEGRKS